jgi:TetR/AcrR family transcriptional regulator, transcriptional repressor for nem operon
MTDSESAAATATSPRRPGKRQRLVDAAAQLLHQQGAERTTLAEIANAADVPPGNVYYYFKTKDDVIAAVIQAHAERIRQDLAAIQAREESPKGRLKSLVREFVSQSQVIVHYGCPLGTLCAELDKRPEDSGLAVAELMRLPVEWAEAQFRSLGRADARDLALDLIAGYEGSALLASTMRDPSILTRAGARLSDWIDGL